MQSYFTLRSETWADGATRHIPLTSLPPGKRVRSIKLYFDLSGTKTGGADALTGDNFPRAVQRVQIGEYVSLAGESLYELNKELFGRIPATSADIAAAGATFDMEFPLTIPFRDPRQSGSDDGSMPCELLDTLNIAITFASATFAGVGTMTVTAGSVYAVAEIVEESAIPQINRLYDFQPGSLTFSLEPGVIKSAFILDGGPNTNGSLTVAELTTIDMSADGLQVWTSARHESVIESYNADAVVDSAGAITVNSASRFPLVWPDRYGKAHLTKQPAIEKGGQVRISAGTLTASTMTVVVWRALPRSEAASNQIADVIGENRAGAVYLPSTATKAPLGSAKKSEKAGRVTRKARVAGLTLAGHFRDAAQV